MPTATTTAWRPPGSGSGTQGTELGTVYTLEETRAITDAAHELGTYLHIDGARLANAAVSLGAELREITTDAGVEVVSFGGTKDGLLMARRWCSCARGSRVRSCSPASSLRSSP